MTATRLHPWIKGTPPEALSEAVFDGKLVAVSGLPALDALAGRVRTIITDLFDTPEPEMAEARMDPGDFRKTVVEARRLVDGDGAVQQHWLDTLASLGFRPGDMLGDRMRLRVVPSRPEARGKRTFPLPAHRDSWGSGLQAQVNWWMPLYPLAETRTMKVWPDAFRQVVDNTSGEWDFETLKREGAENYPLLPCAREAPRTAGEAVLAAPGTLIAFSAAHLHASASDTSGRSRFSLDTRTLWHHDLAAGRGAPNTDNAGREPAWHWFQPLSPAQPPSSQSREGDQP